MNEHGQTPISDLTLERFLLSELPIAEQRRISERLQSDDVLRQRIEDLRTSNQAIFDEAPPATMARRLEKRMSDSESSDTAPWSRWWIPTVAVAAALVIFVPNVLQWPDDLGSGYTGIKGQTPHLVLYKQIDERAERLEDGATVSEGDLIKIVCVSPDEGYGVIFSIDGRDSLMLHRADRWVSFKLVTEKPDTLGFSYQLDDAPEYERFYLVTAEQPFHVVPILKRARQAATETFSLPDQYRLDTIALTKE